MRPKMAVLRLAAGLRIRAGGEAGGKGVPHQPRHPMAVPVTLQPLPVAHMHQRPKHHLRLLSLARVMVLLAASGNVSLAAKL